MFLFTPKIFVSHSNDPKCFNSEIRHHLKCLQSLRRKFKSHQTLHIMNKIQQSEKSLQSKIQQAKSNFESKLIASFHSTSSRSPSSVVYSYIRSISSQSSLPAVMSLDSQSAAGDKEKASLFNKYFHSVFTTSSSALPPTSEMTMPLYSIDTVAFNEIDVCKALRYLDVSKAMGYDGISPMVLKHCAMTLYQPL